MSRAFVLALLLLPVACEHETGQSRGGAWEPCTEDSRCDGGLLCIAVGETAEMCAPECKFGESCTGPTDLVARCDASEPFPDGFCVIDCASDDQCGDGMKCVFTGDAGKGECAWSSS